MLLFYFFLFLYLGVGKTSLCVSLRDNKARYSKDPNYPNEDLRETKFMAQWEIDVVQNENKGILTKHDAKDKNNCFLEYQFNPTMQDNDYEEQVESMGHDFKSADENIDTNEESDKIYAYDCGGQGQYSLLNTISLTGKSVIAIFFHIPIYTSHEDSYQQCVGAYVDMILSRNREVAVILVASGEDQLRVDKLYAVKYRTS